ncbi:MAG: hypothetical protein ACK4JE_05880, partial [Endomicrobiia bacterium]
MNISFSTALKKKFYNDFTLDFEFENFNFIKKKIGGQVYITGKLNFSEGLTAETTQEKTKLKINGYEIKNIKMTINYEKDILKVSKFEVEKNISGFCIFNFDKKTTDGNIEIKELELRKIAGENFDGIMNGNITLLGDITNPEIKFTYSIEKGKYKDFQFSLSGEGNYKEEIISTGKIILTNNETGNFDIKLYKLKEPKIYSKISFDEINLLTINSLTKNFLHKDLPTSGFVSCITKIEGDIYKPNLSLEINSKSKLLYSGKILPETWTNFELFALLDIKKNEIKIDRMNIESDSEIISISSGSTINFSTTNRGKFNTKFKLQNFSLWPVSMFGEITATGEWNKEKDKLKINSKLSISDSWVNQQKIKNLSFKIDYFSNQNKKFIELSPVENQTHQISGKIDFTNPEIVNFENILIQQKKNGKTSTKFQLTGKYTEPQIDFQMEATNVNLDTISSLMNLQLNIDGSTDFIVFIKGN